MGFGEVIPGWADRQFWIHFMRLWVDPPGLILSDHAVSDGSAQGTGCLLNRSLSVPRHVMSNHVIPVLFSDFKTSTVLSTKIDIFQRSFSFSCSKADCELAVCGFYSNVMHETVCIFTVLINRQFKQVLQCNVATLNCLS